MRLKVRVQEMRPIYFARVQDIPRRVQDIPEGVQEMHPEP